MRRGIVMVEKAIKAFAHDRNHTAGIRYRELHLIREQKNDNGLRITQKKAERRERRGCLPSYSGELEACSMMDDVRTMFTPALGACNSAR
jgi:hypothetical protein